jgi:hypothetical protein
MRNTGNKFNDLYFLAFSLHNKKPLKDKTTEEVEFEKSMKECTFHPSISPNINKKMS